MGSRHSGPGVEVRGLPAETSAQRKEEACRTHHLLTIVTLPTGRPYAGLRHLNGPAVDPPFEVSNTGPRPADAPSEPRAVMFLTMAGRAGGWEVRVGYSRGPVRAVKVGTYKRVEVFGVWAGSHPVSGWRWCAMHSRTIGAVSGWTWDGVQIWRPGADGPVAPGLGWRFTDATVTDLKEFIGVSGSVLPGWFKGIHARVWDREERRKLAAKTRPPTRKPKEGSS